MIQWFRDGIVSSRHTARYRIYVKAVPVGAGAVFTFDIQLDLEYNMLNRTVGR